MGKELRRKLDSMDVVQDVLIHALGGITDFTYENEGDFVRWLSRIAERILCAIIGRDSTRRSAIFAKKSLLVTPGAEAAVGFPESQGLLQPPHQV
jgi:DNA-directed RNA polymerase specialized sigma24 family protein